MRVFLLTLVMISFALSSKGQGSYTDSLLQVVKTTKDVGTRVDAAGYYLYHYESESLDSMYYAAEQVLKVGEKLKYRDIQSIAKAYLGYYHHLNGETYKSMSISIEALKLAEQAPSDRLFSEVYGILGIIYEKVNLEKSIQFTKKALTYSAQNTSQMAIVSNSIGLTNLAVSYVKAQQYDSALVAANRALELSMKIHDKTFSYTHLYSSLGRINLELNNSTMAYSYYKLSLQQAKQIKAPWDMTQALIGMGGYHAHAGNPDSALFYFQQYYSKFEQNKAIPISAERALLPMYKIYKAKGLETKALYYLEAYHNAKAKADSTAQTQLIQSLAFEEDLRQQELANVKALAEEERKHNLQFAAIGIGLVALIILFLLLSHSVIANKTLIRFMGMIALLIVFEFFNLLLHPLLGKITHHSPVLMLLVMVSLAAILIPLHHKLEHWITHKMVEKNNRIRLAAAKKVIEQLEVKSTPTIPV